MLFVVNAFAGLDATGRPLPSTRSRSESPGRCALHAAPMISALTTRLRTATENGASRAADIFTEHPGLDLTDVYAAVMADFPYEACVHVHYPESVLPVKDGLLKMRDLLQEKGSSGVSVVE
jgi:hypothetical protein